MARRMRRALATGAWFWSTLAGVLSRRCPGKMNVNKMMKKISSYFPKHKKSDLEKKYEILEKLGTYVARTRRDVWAPSSGWNADAAASLRRWA